MIAETNWSHVGNEEWTSSASQILNTQRDIEQSLQELVSISVFILYLINVVVKKATTNKQRNKRIITK